MPHFVLSLITKACLSQYLGFLWHIENLFHPGKASDTTVIYLPIIYKGNKVPLNKKAQFLSYVSIRKSKTLTASKKDFE